MGMTPTRIVTRLMVAGAFLGAGCTQTNVVPVTVDEVSVIPDRLDALVSDQTTLTTELRDGEGNVLPDRPVRWKSLNPDVVVVDGSGIVTAVGPGQALVTATADGAVGAAQITVQERPKVRLAPDQVALETIRGTSNQVGGTVVVDNGGGGVLGTLSAGVEYTQGEGGWLSAAMESTQAPTELTLSATGKGLATGTYRASVSVTDGESTASVQVSLEVTEPPPELRLSTSSLSFQTVGGQATPGARTVEVTNSGGGSLTGLNVQTSYDGTGGWLSATLSRATAPATLTVRPTTTQLEPGTYTATVTVTTPVASARSVSVSYQVEDPRDFEPPDAPERLRVEQDGPTRIDLEWDDESDNETRFEIQRRSFGQDWAIVATPGADTESYTDEGLRPLTWYQYRVRACNAAGCSAWSNWDSTWTSSG